MDREIQLQNIIRQRKKSKSDNVSILGAVARDIMENRISPRQARFGSVTQLWEQLLPVELRRHCRIADISAGQLKVQVDSPSYMHELRLCSSELLEEFQHRCPRAKIRNIKFVLADTAIAKN